MFGQGRAAFRRCVSAEEILGQPWALVRCIAVRGDDHDPALTAVLPVGGSGGMPSGAAAANHQAGRRFVGTKGE